MHRDEDNLSEQEGASSPVSLAPELSSVELPCVLNAKQLCVKTFTSEEDLKNHMMKAHYGGACINCQLWDPRKKCKERKSCRTLSTTTTDSTGHGNVQEASLARLMGSTIAVMNEL